MSILILRPLNFSADLMKWVSTDVSWKWQHVSLLPGWCSPLVYRCVAWCNHRMAHCHLIKYHSCFDREALIESLVSFIKLCVIFVWNFFFLPSFSHSLSLALIKYANSWIGICGGVGGGGGAEVRRKKKWKRALRSREGERKKKNKSKSERKSEMERGGEIAERDSTEKVPLEAFLSLDS